MTFGYWCVVLTAFLPVIWAGIAKSGVRNFDNRQPRESLAKAEGWAQRANWAQQNSYEAFPPFAAGVIVAHLAGAEQSTIDLLAGIFLAMRILHGIVYIADYASIRSLVWTTGFLCTVALFLSPTWPN